MGETLLVVSGLEVPGVGSAVLKLTEDNKERKESKAFFSYEDNTLETPHYHLHFGSSGAIISLVEKSSGRDLVAMNGSLNNLLIGEDIPARWDNWDIDMDQKLKMQAVHSESKWEIVYEGPLQVRLKNKYKVGKDSSIEQHMVLHRDSLQIDFETRVDWKENHKLLKAEFDLNVQVDRARHEIQYGHLKRDTHDNLPQDRARFEVCNHQWSDLSEPHFGVALLNDCKYGISCNGSNMRLSLLKSGTHPDPSADRGIHSFTYSLLPHNKGFSTAEVIRPARELNTELTALEASEETPALPSLFTINRNNFLLESIKRAEDGDGYIVRLFETEKSYTDCLLKFNRKILKIDECNMLEMLILKKIMLSS